MARATPVPVAWLLCALLAGGGAAAASPRPLPWLVSCPAQCSCQLKPWFSPESSACHEAPTVDCNDLLLTRLPSPLPGNTHTLRLQGNLLSGLQGAAAAADLRRLPNLTELDLSQNRLDGVPAGGPLPALRSLHLEENRLSHLPEASFASLPALQELFLSHNRLRTLAPGAFAGLHALLRLHVNNNRLTTVDPRWFRALPRLEVLMLGGNPVEVLPERGFQALGSLRSLVLGGMGLRGVAETALEGLDALESLSFYDNLLTRVPTRALARVPGLKFLDLNKNRLRLVETGDFRDMAHLKELGLSNMEELVSVERAALENLPELTKLEITNNPRLAYVHPQAFLRLGRLESLMLNSNALGALHGHTLLALPGLREVSLHSNPLRCDCLFRWAAAGEGEGEEEGEAGEPADPPGSSQAERGVERGAGGRRAVRFIQPQATLCSEPPELRARRVREVAAREMAPSCLPSIPRGPLPPYVGVRPGARLALHCRALAEPPPRLFWVTPAGVKLGPASDNRTAPGGEEEEERDAADAPLRRRRGNGHSGDGPYRLSPEGTLEIAAVTAAEAGLYTCVAENAVGADTRGVTVAMLGPGGGRRGRRVRGKQHSGDPPVAPETEEKGRGLVAPEVGPHHAVLSWRSQQNLPSARLSWQALATGGRTHSTRILAGTQSFNLTRLQAATFYRVCLHSGAPSPRGPPRCVSLQTREPPAGGPPPPPPPPPQDAQGLQLPGPELTSTVLTFAFLALTLLVLAGLGWLSGPGGEGDRDGGGGGAKHHPRLDERASLHQDC